MALVFIGEQYHVVQPLLWPVDTDGRALLQALARALSTADHAIVVPNTPFQPPSINSNKMQLHASVTAYDATHTRMASCDVEGQLKVYNRTTAWTLQCSLPTEHLHIVSMGWAAPQFGGVLAAGAADGSVAVWQEDDSGWRLAAVLNEAALAVQALTFAPPEHGLLLAAACADGFVRQVGSLAPVVPALQVTPACAMPGRRLFSASNVLAAASWRLENQFCVASGGAATALAWRLHTPGVPPMLLVGTAAAGAQVWQYQQRIRRWEPAVMLGSSQVRRTMVPASEAARPCKSMA